MDSYQVTIRVSLSYDELTKLISSLGKEVEIEAAPTEAPKTTLSRNDLFEVYRAWGLSARAQTILCRYGKPIPIEEVLSASFEDLLSLRNIGPGLAREIIEKRRPLAETEFSGFRGKWGE